MNGLLLPADDAPRIRNRNTERPTRSRTRDALSLTDPCQGRQASSYVRQTRSVWGSPRTAATAGRPSSGLIDGNVYLTRSAAIEAIGEYIDGFYDLPRRPSALDYVSPIETALNIALDELGRMAA